MSEGSDSRRQELDRRDALISAAIDSALEPAEREELERLLAEGDAAIERDRAFRRVDEALRTIGREPIRDARLEEMLASVNARIEAEAPGPNGGLLARSWPLAFAAAAAALFAFYLVGPSSPPRVQDTSPIADVPVDALLVAEDLVLAIGYGDELSELGAIPNDDFEVIEQLELLDYMLDREGLERSVPDRDMEDRG